MRGRRAVAPALAILALAGAIAWAARVPCDLAALDYADMASAEVMLRDTDPEMRAMAQEELAHGAAMPAPFPARGEDPTADALGCGR